MARTMRISRKTGRKVKSYSHGKYAGKSCSTVRRKFKGKKVSTRFRRCVWSTRAKKHLPGT